MHEALRTALYILVHADLSADSIAVHDYVPDNTTSYPYVAIGEVAAAAEDTDSSDGALVRAKLLVSSKYKGGKECAEILDRLRTLLHHTEALVVPGSTVVSVYVEGTSQDPDAEAGELREGELDLAVRLDDITPGTA
jgi:hypothetical protein